VIRKGQLVYYGKRIVYVVKVCGLWALVGWERPRPNEDGSAKIYWKWVPLHRLRQPSGCVVKYP
jgi:hypothetical protein